MQIPGYWRFSAFYFFYFAVLGAVVPYLPLYLQERGFGAWQIGLLMSLMLGTKMVAPNFWGWLADRSGRRLAIIRLGNLLAMLTFALIFVCGDSWLGLALVIVTYSFFWNAVLAQFEVITLLNLGEYPERYSRIRLWGSVGFIAAVAGLGWLFDRLSLLWFPWLVLAGLLAILLSSYLVEDGVPQQAAEHLTARSGFFASLRQPAVLALLGTCFFMVMSHGPYYTFFTLLMERHDYSRTAIGLLWSLGVLAEIVLFWYMHRLLPHWGVQKLMQFSLMMTVLRWMILALFPSWLILMGFCQLLHAFSFAGFHAAAIEAVRRAFPPASQGQAQALYSAVGYGAGNAVGALAGGWLWQFSTALPFWSAVLCAALALLLSGRAFPARKHG